MTGYSKIVKELDGIQFTLEVKGVNHKYLNLSFSLPALFSSFEVKAIPIVRHYVNRGSLLIKAEIGGDFEADLVQPDLALAKAYYKAIKSIKEELGLSSAEVSDESILGLKELFKMEIDEETEKKIWKGFENVLREALEKFNESRKTEGEKLKAYLEAYLNEFEELLKIVRKYEEKNRQRYEEMIRERIKSFSSVEIDKERFEQEVIMMIQRADISEELVRLESHLSRARNLMGSQEAVGSELDFVFQEFGREVNTLSNKSKVSEVLDCVVKAKTLVKKLREQVQNIE